MVQIVGLKQLKSCYLHKHQVWTSLSRCSLWYVWIAPLPHRAQIYIFSYISMSMHINIHLRIPLFASSSSNSPPSPSHSALDPRLEAGAVVAMGDISVFCTLGIGNCMIVYRNMYQSWTYLQHLIIPVWLCLLDDPRGWCGTENNYFWQSFPSADKHEIRRVGQLGLSTTSQYCI